MKGYREGKGIPIGTAVEHILENNQTEDEESSVLQLYFLISNNEIF